MSSGTAPLPPSDAPGRFRSPSPKSQPTLEHLSSPVKNPLRQHFAEHKCDEVQDFGYDKAAHMLKDFDIQEEVFDFLGVADELLEVSPKVPGENSAKRSGKSRGKAKETAKAKDDGDPNEFTHSNFIQASNRLSEAMKKDREFTCCLIFLFLNDFY